MSQVGIGVIGAAGKMGRRIVSCILANPKAKLSSALEAAGCAALGSDAGVLAGAAACGVNVLSDRNAAFRGSDVMIDFSSVEAFENNLETAVQLRIPLVVGVTGMSRETMKKAEDASSAIPLLIAPNMSLGVNVAFAIAGMIAKALGDDYDIEVVEAHHRLKKDAPSGTAMELGRVLAAARGTTIEQAGVFERHGNIGPRVKGTIGLQTLRAGDIVGDHTVLYAGQDERIELTHRAHSRDAFARGAVAAALWLAGREEGLYSMRDVLGLASIK